jgi:hypothetical protein
VDFVFSSRRRFASADKHASVKAGVITNLAKRGLFVPRVDPMVVGWGTTGQKKEGRVVGGRHHVFEADIAGDLKFAAEVTKS